MWNPHEYFATLGNNLLIPRQISLASRSSCIFIEFTSTTFVNYFCYPVSATNSCMCVICHCACYRIPWFTQLADVAALFCLGVIQYSESAFIKWYLYQKHDLCLIILYDIFYESANKAQQDIDQGGSCMFRLSAYDLFQ